MLRRALIAAYTGFGIAWSLSCTGVQNNCPGPSSERWIEYDENNPPDHRIILRTTILRRGDIVWNNVNISEEQLILYLRRLHEMSPAPYLVLQYETGLPCRQIGHFREIFETHASCGRASPCSELRLPELR